MSRRVGAVTAFLAGLGVVIVALPAGAQSSNEIQVKRAEVDQASTRLSEIQTEVGAAYEDYEEALGGLEEINGEISSTGDNLIVAEKDLVEAQNDLDTQASRVYKSGNVGFLDVLMGVDSFSEFATRLNLWVRVLTEQREEVQKVEAVRDELETEKANLEAKRQERNEAVDVAVQRRSEALDQEAVAREYLTSMNGELRAAVEAKVFAEQQAAERQRQILAARQAEIAAQIQAQAEEAARKAAAQQAAAKEAARQQRLAEQRAAELAAQKEAQQAAAQAAAEEEAARQAEIAAQEQAAAEAAAQQAAAEQQAAEEAAAAEAEIAAQEAAQQQAAEEAAAQQQYEEEQAAAEEAAAQEAAAQEEAAAEEEAAAQDQYTPPAQSEGGNQNGGAQNGGETGGTTGGVDSSGASSSNPNYAWQPHVAQVANLVEQQFGATPSSYSGHMPSGDLAIDFFGSNQQVADYLAANADSLGLSYIMYNNEFYSTFPNYNGPAYQWVYWGDGEHGDHVHVSFCASGQSGTYC